jgi:ATP-dependent helicase HrpB
MPEPSSLPVLPIDTLLPEISERLREHRCLVIEAAPGAGKTTRVPPRLLSLWPEDEIVVLEPRRLAAHLSAARVAEERGESLGATVGVQMRFDSVCGPATRLRYVTEGVLLRQLLREPELPKVAAVVLDEFHERHLQADLALALLRRLQQGPRRDLRIVVMSATLASEQVAAFLDGCPIVRSQGRSYPVKVQYLQQPDSEPLARQVSKAVRELLRSEAQDVAVEDAGGDILVF